MTGLAVGALFVGCITALGTAVLFLRFYRRHGIRYAVAGWVFILIFVAALATVSVAPLVGDAANESFVVRTLLVEASLVLGAAVSIGGLGALAIVFFRNRETRC